MYTSTPNQITIGSNVNGYGICNITDSNGELVDVDVPLDLSGSNWGDNTVSFFLKPSTNMVRIYTDENSLAAYDIIINAFDTITSWRNGQNVRVVFPNMTLDALNSRNIIFRTNLAAGVDSDVAVEVVVPSDELIGDKPIIEFTCTDSTFSNADSIVYDVLR